MNRSAADVIRYLNKRIARLEIASGMNRMAAKRLQPDLQAFYDKMIMDLRRLALEAQESESEDSDALHPYMDGKNVKAFVTEEIEGLLFAIQKARGDL